MIHVSHIINSVFSSRTYILERDGQTDVYLVDCGDIERVFEIIGERSIAGVLLTHTHSDHIYGIPLLLATFPKVRLVTNEYGLKALANPKLNLSKYHSEYSQISIGAKENIDVVSEGDEVFGHKVLSVPGHDPSCLCYYDNDYIFTGDSYIPEVSVFAGFPNSDKQQAEISRNKIITYSTGRIICPGHEIYNETC